jgi:hypothetical protein
MLLFVETPQLNIECSLFISCHNRNVDTNLFYALNENSIVYDGRLTIDERWTTNDPLVMGAGPVARFSRLYVEYFVYFIDGCFFL